jgi:hypothetical protein
MALLIPHSGVAWHMHWHPFGIGLGELSKVPIRETSREVKMASSPKRQGFGKQKILKFWR